MGTQFIETLECRRLYARTIGGPHKGVRSPTESDSLTAADVTQIIGQAASQARPGQAIVISDKEGVILGIWGGRGLDDDRTIEDGTGAIIAVPDELNKVIETATSRARTAALFSSNENAFTTRTARFIIQDHFPQNVKNTPGGPLYGVQFSSIRGADQLRNDQTNFPVISGDSGGVPIYKNGIAVGGIGVAGDGRDLAARPELVPIQIPGFNPEARVFQGKEESDFDEAVALAGTKGFEAPKRVQANRIFVDGLRFPYTRNKAARGNPTRSLADLISLGAGSLRANAYLETPATIRDSVPPPFATATFGGVPGFLKTTKRFDAATQTLVDVPNSVEAQIIDSNDTDGSGNLLPDSQRLTEADVETILNQAVARANNTRALIREPNGVPAKVHVAIVDRDGDPLAIFRMIDAPNFGYDVSLQKARSVAFFSDDNHAFTVRALGFLSQQFYPIGITGGTVPGPLFNVQDRLTLPGVGGEKTSINFAPVVSGQKNPLTNGLNIFPGGAPLYKNGVLVGGIGISGDGVDQDEIIAYSGTKGYRPSLSIRSDQLPISEVKSFIVGKLRQMTQLYDLSFLPASSLPTEDVPKSEEELIEAAIARFDQGGDRFRLPYLRLPRNADIGNGLDDEG